MPWRKNYVLICAHIFLQRSKIQFGWKQYKISIRFRSPIKSWCLKDHSYFTKCHICRTDVEISHKRHLNSHLYGHAIGCLLWVYERPATLIHWDFTMVVVDFFPTKKINGVLSARHTHSHDVSNQPDACYN